MHIKIFTMHKLYLNNIIYYKYIKYYTTNFSYANKSFINCIYCTSFIHIAEHASKNPFSIAIEQKSPT